MDVWMWCPREIYMYIDTYIKMLPSSFKNYIKVSLKLFFIDKDNNLKIQSNQSRAWTRICNSSSMKIKATYINQKDKGFYFLNFIWSVIPKSFVKQMDKDDWVIVEISFTVMCLHFSKKIKFSLQLICLRIVHLYRLFCAYINILAQIIWSLWISFQTGNQKFPEYTDDPPVKDS